MKTILKKGYKKLPEDYVYVKKCRTCGCIFTYQLKDIDYYCDLDRYVECPNCGYSCDIIFNKKYKGDLRE